MKPTWNNAPSWARYLAMDRVGEWYWYDHKPIAGTVSWFYGEDEGRHEFAGNTPLLNDWTDTLEARPEEIER